MSGFILVIDDRGRLEPLVSAAVAGADVAVGTAVEFESAKATLSQHRPDLILCASKVGGDLEASANFCSELQMHPLLSAVPVMFVADSLTEDVIRAATQCGAKGLIPWPIAVDTLRSRMMPLVPELAAAPLPPPTAPAAGNLNTGRVPPRPSIAPTPQTAGVQTSLETDPKLQHAQKLLAQVLHNLKTSDLLPIIDLDDVPRVVFEMTRTVCGIGAAEPEGKTNIQEQVTDIDLDSAFGLRRK